MPRRMHAEAAALSRRRRFARCSSRKSCMCITGCERLAEISPLLCKKAVGYPHQPCGAVAYQRAQAAKLVLLEQLPGVVVLVLPLICFKLGLNILVQFFGTTEQQMSNKRHSKARFAGQQPPFDCLKSQDPG